MPTRTQHILNEIAVARTELAKPSPSRSELSLSLDAIEHWTRSLDLDPTILRVLDDEPDVVLDFGPDPAQAAASVRERRLAYEATMQIVDSTAPLK